MHLAGSRLLNLSSLFIDRITDLIVLRFSNLRGHGDFVLHFIRNRFRFVFITETSYSPAVPPTGCFNKNCFTNMIVA